MRLSECVLCLDTPSGIGRGWRTDVCLLFQVLLAFTGRRSDRPSFQPSFEVLFVGVDEDMRGGIAPDRPYADACFCDYLA